MMERRPRQPVEVRLLLDDAGVDVRVYGHDDRLVDEYHAAAASIAEAQEEVTDRYLRLGYRPEGTWRPQRWTASRSGYGPITHESSCKFR